MRHSYHSCLLILILNLPFHAAAQQPEQPAPRPSTEAAQHFKLPEGFRATLFAGEPDIVQPIAITFDDRGRVWIVECLSYPKWQETGRDRVVILEDVDGDGRFDKKKVFLDNGANLTGIELGHGGVWLTAVPKLLFIPDADGDDVPDGPAQTILDGWDLTAKHNVVNGLTWGPDGYLYGCNGILSNSRVGPPGTPDAKRTALNCGVWRYEPHFKTFEVFANGTTNPWGLAFDERGEMFITNCVIEHVFHVTRGGHYKRMFGQDLSPYAATAATLMQSCADHIHWAGGAWQSSRGGQGEHSDAGGGHAHSGAMIYLGDNWPDEYRGNLFTCNIHGNRVNRDSLERKGSGYVARHEKDFLFANDSWFRGLAIKYGPDGGVYVLDWSDTGECHDYEDIHRENGRIYKITFGAAKHWQGDLQKLKDEELVELLRHRNRWFGDHARRILRERKLAKEVNEKELTAALWNMLDNDPDEWNRLQAFHALYNLRLLTDNDTLKLLDHPQETIQGWAIRRWTDVKTTDSRAYIRMGELAASSPSPYVRLQLASALIGSWYPEYEQPAAHALISRPEDADDPNLPLMAWYATAPLMGRPNDQVAELLRAAQIPVVRRNMAQLLASRSPPSLGPVLQVLAKTQESETQHDLLSGLLAGLEGRKGLQSPPEWTAVYARLSENKDLQLRELATRVALALGDEQAVVKLRSIIADKSLDAINPGLRERALGSLVQTRRPEVAEMLVALLDDAHLRAAAIAGMAAFERDTTAPLLIKRYSTLNDVESRSAIATLISRPKYAAALLGALEQNQIPRDDLSEYDWRQLAELPDANLQERLKQIAAKAPLPTSEERAALIAKMKQMVLAGDSTRADAARGRALFEKYCATCHTLFGQGRHVGPDLTGSQRTNLDYVLTNVLDPGALVGSDYRIRQIVTSDGRVLGGIVKAEDANTVTLETATERVVLAKDEIEQQKDSRVSMMPEGLLARLSDQEIRDLIKYLASPQQISAK